MRLIQYTVRCILKYNSLADMKDSKAGRNSPCGDGSSNQNAADGKSSSADGGDCNFPVSAFYELESRGAIQ